MGRLLMLWLIINAVLVNAQQWDLTDPGSEGVEFIGNEIYLDEENEAGEGKGVVIAIITYTGPNKADITYLYPNDAEERTGINVRQNTETSFWEIVITKRQDYESGYIKFEFDVVLNGFSKLVTLHIRNIDDCTPYITSKQPQCQIEEESADVNCLYTITDEDGNLEDITWTINEEDEHEIFEFKLVGSRPIPPAQKEMDLKLALKQLLDFKTASFHIIDLNVKDTLHSVRLRIIIDVIDIPNQPPVWSKIFQSQEFDEKSHQEYDVIAQDGDIVVNAPISYSRSFQDEDWSEYISIGSDTGKIAVLPIDRDEKEREIFKFQVKACDPDECIIQEITFIITDINDNAPTFIVDPAAEDNVVFLKLEETKISTIETKITVIDRDLGENARYSLRLEGESPTNHQNAFSVAPASGYQQTKVDLFIINAALLDYEEEDWQNFSFKLVADEDVPSHLPMIPVTFNVELINRNDEIPIFQSCNDDVETQPDACVKRIPETVSGNTYLITMVAHDRDIDGEVKHELLGAYANRILTIDPITGEISTQNLVRPFDYETLSEVIVQVRATDSLKGDTNENIVLAQLTIKLTDVNDETPTISVQNGGITIDENRDDNYNTGVQIIATDEDSTANLKVYINWDESYGFKNGRRLTTTETDGVFTKYRGCVILDIDESSTGKEVIASLRFKWTDDTKNNMPDFETFDTLDLRIVALDQGQPISDDVPNSVSISVQIYIADINDNEPEFTNIDTSLRVKENTCKETLIGFITATDKDVDNILEYSLAPRDGTSEGLVTIDTKTGRLEVDGTTTDDCSSIDADFPIFYLYYTVTVTDGEHPVSLQIEIYVEDENDINPVFNSGQETTVNIKEAAVAYTEVGEFSATDGDRDEMNNKLTYSISTNTRSELRNYFEIDEETGRVYVFYKTEQKLDRDDAIPEPPLTITIDARDSGARSDSFTFTVQLDDINNKVPQLQTTQMTIGEESAEGVILPDPITATDADDETLPNSYVSFQITSIEAKGDGKTADNDLFVITDPNPAARTAKLKTGKPLEGYYDDFEVTVEMWDHGTDPQQQRSEGQFTITITKFNFKDPVFTYPDNGMTIFLSKMQVPDTPIIMWGGGTLQPLTANDDQGNKFRVSYEVDDVKNLITLYGEHYLAVKRTDFELNVPFDITIKAITEGNPRRETTVAVTLIFVDENISPEFSIDTHQIKDFSENEKEQEHPFPAAKYENDLDLGLKIHYVVQSAASPFTIRNSEVAKLYLKDSLDREVQKIHTVIVQASKQEGGIGSPADEALLTIEIELRDQNDNRPEFEETIYYAIFHYDDKAGAVLKTEIRAIDPDDDDELIYLITNEDLSMAKNFPTFDLDIVKTVKGYEAQLKLTQDGSSTASGYATLTITAKDGDDAHDVGVPVEVYVVSEEEHIVKFKFDNEPGEVEAVKNQIEELLKKVFKDENGISYEANVKRVTPSTDDEDPAVKTAAEVYFIDTERHAPLHKTAIEILANDISIYVRLRQDFEEIDLILVKFSTMNLENDNTVEVLRAWLIGVAVVLGALCVLLIVAFVLKTRSLTKRLNKLSVTKYGSQESGLNRKAVPNTNRNALEGSNPVFSSEKKTPEFDQESIGSGDSDFIGVENNPDFQQKPEKNGLN